MATAAHCSITEPKNIELKYLSPEFVWDDMVPTSLAGRRHRDHNLPWISEIRPVQPENQRGRKWKSQWPYIFTMPCAITYPSVSSSDAMEVVRVSETSQAQNPQFNWAK